MVRRRYCGLLLEAKDNDSRTTLCWAAYNGHEALSWIQNDVIIHVKTGPGDLLRPLGSDSLFFIILLPTHQIKKSDWPPMSKEEQADRTTCSAKCAATSVVKEMGLDICSDAIVITQAKNDSQSLIIISQEYKRNTNKLLQHERSRKEDPSYRQRITLIT